MVDNNKRPIWRVPPIIAASSLFVAAVTFCTYAVADPSPPTGMDPSASVFGTSATSGPFSVHVDFLGWSVSGDKLPALVTTGAPIRPMPGAHVLFGDATINDDWRLGGQLTGGYFFDPQHRRGVELSFFALADSTTTFSADSNSFGRLDRPFLNAATGLPDSMLVAFPGLASGGINVSATSRFLGAQALYQEEMGALGKVHISALAGYRFLYEGDHLDIGSNSTFGAASAISTRDSFRATTAFHGIDLGVICETREGPLSIEWRAAMAVGANLNGAQIGGTTTISADGTMSSMSGGLLALSSNIGSYEQTHIGLAPEFSLTAAYEFFPQWQLVVGYHLIYWTGVQRAGNFIDTTIDPALIPPATGGGQRPAARFNTTALLAQGLSFGVKYDF